LSAVRRNLKARVIVTPFSRSCLRCINRYTTWPRPAASHSSGKAAFCPRLRIDSYTSSNDESLPLCRLAPADQAGGVGPHSQSNPTASADGPRPAPGATATRDPPVAQPGEDATRRQQPNTGPPSPTRSQQDRGLRRHRPGATASRTTPVAQPGRGRDSPPAARPRAAASPLRSVRPRPQTDRNPPPAQRRLGTHRSHSRRR
jgi:hypothetical protein